MTSEDQCGDDEREFIFIRDNEDYLRYSSGIFYELIGDGLVRVMLFERQRMYDTKVEFTLLVPGPGEDTIRYWSTRLFDSDGRVRTDIRKEETDRIMEEYLRDSVHLPIGCIDGTTPPGKYWMFNDEIQITDPSPSFLDVIGIQDWTLTGGCPACEGRFTGNLRDAMDRYYRAKMFTAQSMLDIVYNRALLGKDESDEDSHPFAPCRLIADGFPDYVFIFQNGFLEIYEDDKPILVMSVSKMDHFTQNKH